MYLRNIKTSAASNRLEHRLLFFPQCIHTQRILKYVEEILPEDIARERWLVEP